MAYRLNIRAAENYIFCNIKAHSTKGHERSVRNLSMWIMEILDKLVLLTPIISLIVVIVSLIGRLKQAEQSGETRFLQRQKQHSQQANAKNS